jgi:hypothetical protein
MTYGGKKQEEEDIYLDHALKLSPLVYFIPQVMH